MYNTALSHRDNMVVNCYFFLGLKPFPAPVCQRKRKIRAFTDTGLLFIKSCWRGALCKANREKHHSEVIFKSRNDFRKKNSQRHSQQQRLVPGSLTNICLHHFTPWLPECHSYSKEERDWAGRKYSIFMTPPLINSFDLLDFDRNICTSSII